MRETNMVFVSLIFLLSLPEALAYRGLQLHTTTEQSLNVSTA
jgi:hypothetical protein